MRAIFSFVPRGKLLASCFCKIQTGCTPSAISHGSAVQFVKSKISASQIRGRVLSSPLGIYRYGNATWKLLGVRLPGRAPDFRIKWRTLSCGHTVNLWPLRHGNSRTEMVSSTFELARKYQSSLCFQMTSLIARDQSSS